MMVVLWKHVYAGVISRGTQGVEPSLLEFLIILGAQPPQKLFTLALLFKVY